MYEMKYVVFVHGECAIMTPFFFFFPFYIYSVQMLDFNLLSKYVVEL